MAIKRLVIAETEKVDPHQNRAESIKAQIKTAQDALELMGDDQKKSERAFNLKQRIATLKMQLDRLNKRVSDNKERESKEESNTLPTGRRINLEQFRGHTREDFLRTAEALQKLGAVQYRRATKRDFWTFEVTYGQVTDLMRWIGANKFKAGYGMWYDPTGNFATMRLISTLTKEDGTVLVELLEPSKR